jgi:MYXO-CTERM domain-containing protein
MKLFSSSLFRVASLALALPILGMCDSYTVNVTGTTLAVGQSTSGSPTTSTVLADGDSYTISAPYSASNTATTLGLSYFPVVTYTGSTPLPSGYDSITVDYFQTFTGPGLNGLYTETIPLLLTGETTASMYLMVGGTALPTISLSGPGYYVGTGSAEISGLSGSVTEEYSITCDFFVGSPSGSSCSSPSSSTPEPAQLIPAALSLVGFGLVALRRRKK